MVVTDSARRLAETYLADTLPRRWTHVRGVGARAESVGTHLSDAEILISAAWLHDIGYAPSLATTQFHPLDGARAVHALGFSSRLCGLVAYHSAALYEAEVLGLSNQVLMEFSDETDLIRDLLWYLDMTTSPDGDRVTFDRMDDVRARYPENHYVIEALEASMVERRSAVDRALAWLTEFGLAAYV